MPKKLADNFVNERYRKDQQYIFVYDTYTPNYNSKQMFSLCNLINIAKYSILETNVTAKFYSKYEGAAEEVDPTIYKNLKRAKDFGPKLKLIWPETSNQKLVTRKINKF